MASRPTCARWQDARHHAPRTAAEFAPRTVKRRQSQRATRQTRYEAICRVGNGTALRDVRLVLRQGRATASLLPTLA
jgi:hypothetical protein